MPAPTSAAAFSGSIRPCETPRLVMTTMSGSPVAEKRARGTRSSRGRAVR